MKTSTVQTEDRPKPTKGLTETRYIFAMMAFIGCVLAFADRVVLNVAIVGMVDRCKPPSIYKDFWPRKYLINVLS